MSDKENYIVLIASEFKGNEFIEECASNGWHTTLITRENLLSEGWSWSHINQVKSVTPDAKPEDYARTIANLAGNQPIHRIAGLDEFDILTAARAREFFQIEGVSSSYSIRFRDKLTMRNAAKKARIACPDFVGIFNQDEINRFLEKTAAPWIIKPRMEVSAFGIKKCESKEEVWESIKRLDQRNTWRDHPAQFLIEEFIKGDVFHVDSVVNDGKVIAAGVSGYAQPPMKVTHEGGVFATSLLSYKSKTRRELETLNRKLLKAFDFKKGVTHAEFLRCAQTGKFYLLEIAMRVGGAYISTMLEAACGFNLWREWAKLEIATKENPYKSPNIKKEYAGIALCLANENFPDTSAYTDEEIIYRVSKPNHTGFVFHSKNYERIEELLNSYTERLTNDFLSVVPIKERHDE